jgi:ribosomal protein S14
LNRLPEDNRCTRCGRSSHIVNDCFARTDVRGNYLESGSPVQIQSSLSYNSNNSYQNNNYGSYEDSDSDSDSGGGSDSCFRCGREGHWSSNCYARTDIYGNRL